jgi:hypothetical protein
MKTRDEEKKFETVKMIYSFYSFIQSFLMSRPRILQDVFDSVGYVNIPHLKRAPANEQYKISLREMTTSVMKHKTSIVVAVYGHGAFVLSDFKDDPPVTSVKGVILFQQCFKKDGDQIWFLEGSCSNAMIASAIRLHHDSGDNHTGNSLSVCENCDFDGKWIKLRWIEELLAGKNPLFKISLSDQMTHKEISDAEYSAWQAELDDECD